MPNTVKLYALSTCIHCKNTKKFLDDNNVEYDFVYVDTLEGDERKNVIAEVKQYNPSTSFPTIVVDEGAKVVVGFRKDEIKEALGI